MISPLSKGKIINEQDQQQMFKTFESDKQTQNSRSPKLSTQEKASIQVLNESYRNMKGEFEQAKDCFIYKIKTLEEKNEKYRKDNMYLKKINNSKNQDLIRLYKMDDMVN